jgi:ribosomal protein S18 acetylase RimI-like enzyme
MDIRRATPDDAVALATVHIDSWRIAYRGLVPDSYLDGLSYERRAQRFRDSLAQDAVSPEETYLAEQNGELLGFLTLGGSRDEDVDRKTTGEIWGIYLGPGHWRKGIGTLFCRYGESILEGRGYQSVVLWVFAGNDQARRFYEAMGYGPDGGTRTLNLGTPLEAVRYRKGLKEAEPCTPADCVQPLASRSSVHNG